MRRKDKDRKRDSAELLFDAIGMIDDSIIEEAERVREPKSTPSFAGARRVLALAATVALLSVGVIGAFLIADNADTAPTYDNDGMSESKDDGEYDFYLHLLTASGTGGAKRLAENEIDLFDGSLSLIWCYGEDDSYYKLSLDSTTSEKQIRNKLSKSNVIMNAERAREISYRVWISFGNGEVVSPYLKESKGNVGYGELFEYNPEVEPDSSFTSLVSDAIISQ